MENVNITGITILMQDEIIWKGTAFKKFDLACNAFHLISLGTF
jgi:hypothetical protein